MWYFRQPKIFVQFSKSRDGDGVTLVRLSQQRKYTKVMFDYSPHCINIHIY